MYSFSFYRYCTLNILRLAYLNQRFAFKSLIKTGNSKSVFTKQMNIVIFMEITALNSYPLYTYVFSRVESNAIYLVMKAHKV